MTDQTTPQNTTSASKAEQTQLERPKRRKKAPPIDFNALDERDHKLLQSIATTGARVAGRQQKLRESQLNAMKSTLADILADSDVADPRFLEQLFEVMLANANPANAKKIASHTLCPPKLADAYQRRA